MDRPRLDLSRQVARESVCLYAHTPSVGEPERWHGLADHLLSVAELASEFAEPFGGSSFAYFVGLTHDIGKAMAEVQSAFRDRHRDGGRRLGVPHKAEGAAAAWLLYEVGNRPAATAMLLANYGHHSKIPDFAEAKDILIAMGKRPDGLDALIKRIDDATNTSIREVASQVELPDWATDPTDRRPLEMFTRMAHSALVDADFLDTAAHFDDSRRPRRNKNLGMEAMRDTFMGAYNQRFPVDGTTELSRIRRELFERSVSAAATDGKARIFRLPAPTGTGKTMSAAAFALSHAARFGKRRVIVAVPFTSITTQNAEAYRGMLSTTDSDVVLEHHSNILDDRLADDQWRRLSASNWDAEFIVTTTVQLFTSLMASNPASTRRLHRLANSVIVLDEVQALRLELVPVILQVLRELNENFGVTVLLASATQPAFWAHPAWQGLDFVDVMSYDEFPEATQRVRYEVREDKEPLESIAAELAAEDSALAIVSTTANARVLHELIVDRSRPGDNVFHLSTRMCNAHRLDVLTKVRDHLTRGIPVKLVSTQLIEAGVDVDFPVVFRALAPAESIVQAAGRCNREGKLGVRGGRVVVFDPTDATLPSNLYKSITDITRSIFVDQAARENPRVTAFGELSSMERYFERLSTFMYKAGDGDIAETIDTARQDLNFPKVSKHFQMIEEVTVPVVVPAYVALGDGRDLRELLDHDFRDPTFVPTKAQRRLLHKYTASAPASALTKPGLVSTNESGPYEWLGGYDEQRGLVDEAGSWIL